MLHLVFQIKLDHIWLPCENSDTSSLLLFYMIISSFCRVPSRTGKILRLGDSKSGMSFIFKCLFLWNIFLIWENAKQDLSPNCMVLWSNAPTVWASLLHNRWHFCVNFYELFLQVSSWIHYRIKAENGAVYPRNTQTHTFISCVFPCLFLFLLYFYSVMTRPYISFQLFCLFLQCESDYFELIWSQLQSFHCILFLGAWRPIIQDEVAFTLNVFSCLVLTSRKCLLLIAKLLLFLYQAADTGVLYSTTWLSVPFLLAGFRQQTHENFNCIFT